MSVITGVFFSPDGLTDTSCENEYSPDGKMLKNLELLYDVPRSVRRVSPVNQVGSEAIYVNDDFVAANDNLYNQPK